MRVLLLDDSPAERELMHEAAQEFAHKVTLVAVATPLEAMDELALCAADLVLIDLHLGRWNGRELLAQVRGRVGSVILSTTDDVSEAKRCVAAGALGFWVKPLHYIEYIDLFARIHAVVMDAGKSLKSPSGRCAAAGGEQR